MTLAIIDYGSGNLRSVAKAFERVGKGSAIAVTRDAKALKNASHIVLPGVGAFADCMQGLQKLPGMGETLQEEVLARGKYFLGICVGMQMLFQKGHEHGTHNGLGWLKGEVVPLQAKGLKVPHMGWNNLQVKPRHALSDAIATGNHAYFVHSFHAKCGDESDIAATAEYGETIASVVMRGNIMGTQFHPEKSQETGLKLLQYFIRQS